MRNNGSAGIMAGGMVVIPVLILPTIVVGRRLAETSIRSYRAHTTRSRGPISLLGIPGPQCGFISTAALQDGYSG